MYSMLICSPSSPSLRYDSLTGVPSCQRTLAFEKGSVLFNLGALFTQIGARQDRSATVGIDRAVDAFQRAAGGDVGALIVFHIILFRNRSNPHCVPCARIV